MIFLPFSVQVTKPMEKLKFKGPIIGTARATTSPINIVTQLPLNGTGVARIMTWLSGWWVAGWWRKKVQEFTAFSIRFNRKSFLMLNYIDLKHRVVVVLEQKEKSMCLLLCSVVHCVSDGNHSSIVACGWHLCCAGNICPSHESVHHSLPIRWQTWQISGREEDKINIF